MDEPVRVFVYGTLMPGGCRWPHLSRFAASCEPATATGRLWDTGRGYPAARFAADGDEIPGVAVTLKAEGVAEAVRMLDEVEWEGTLYRRVEVPTSVGPALSYEWLGSTLGLTPIAGGWEHGPGA